MSNVLVRDLVGIPPYLRDQLGGARSLRVLHGSVSHADDGTAVVIGHVPADAIVLGAFVTVGTAFDGTGTDLIDVGTNTDPDGFAASVDASSAGNTFNTGGALVGTISTADQVEVLYTDTNGDATEGAADVTVLYLEA